jgi:PAS domain S-box-containing protein
VSAGSAKSPTELFTSGESASLLLNASVDSSDDAIISEDRNSIVTGFNKGAERLFGYTAAEMVGRPIQSLRAGHERFGYRL